MKRPVVTLIEPPVLFSGTQVSAHVMIPLGIASLAAWLRQRQDVDVQVIDSVGEALETVTDLGDGRFRRGLDPQAIVDRVAPEACLVGIRNAFAFAFSTVADLVARLKERFPDVPVVLGGDNASAMPEHCLARSRADAVAVGEGEAVLSSLLDAVREGRPIASVPGVAWRDGERVVRNPRPPFLDVDALPMPDYSQVRLHRYWSVGGGFGPSRGPWLPILSSRGCPNRCRYCTSPFMWERRYRTRSPAAVVDEMISRHRDLGVVDLHFYDLNFGCSLKWFRAFLDECARLPRGLTWQLVTGIRPESVTAETAQKMAQRGCVGASVAPETYSEALRRSTGKRMSDEAVFGAIRHLSAAGIPSNAYFLVGIPGETARDLKELPRLLRRLARLGLDDVGISVLKLLPGSDYYENFRARGLIRPDDAFLDRLVFQSDLDRMDASASDLPADVLRAAVMDAHLAFFAWKFAYRPGTLVEVLRNAITGRETTRLDRVLRTRRAELARVLGHAVMRQVKGFRGPGL